MSTPEFSLLDLSKQFPFEIDSDLRKQLCFSETLIISCGHYEGKEDYSSKSSSCCPTSEASEISEKKELKTIEIKDPVKEEIPPPPEVEEENNFHFYFFPDCKKPKVHDSNATIITVNGFPALNKKIQEDLNCYCNVNQLGLCDCEVKYPCKCTGSEKDFCECDKLKHVCKCFDPSEPILECPCEELTEFCLCNPNSVKEVCECQNINQPCLCEFKDVGQGPCPVPFDEANYKYPTKDLHECTCKGESTIGASSENKTCLCDPNTKKQVCDCYKLTMPCLCDSKTLKPVCDCEKNICLCEDEIEEVDNSCPCPSCVCDETKPKKSENECSCPIEIYKPEPEQPKLCTCGAGIKSPVRKLKRTRTGKHGYRWCEDVDPYHTFFDYGYNLHDKISYKEQIREKLKIYGIDNDPKEEEDCPVHATKAPPYVKKVCKPSLDCCSSVGGICISVEVMSNEKYLVQVVSHSTKETFKTGFKLISIVDFNLHTLEESRTEYAFGKKNCKEWRSYITISESGYYNKVSCQCGEKNRVKRYYHTFEEAHDFLLEGANIILLRYFGLNRFKGTVKTDTVLIGGEVCESIYVSHGVSPAIVNNKQLFVVKVERHIIQPNGKIHQTLTVLSLKGYTVSHEWADTSYIMHLNPLLNINPEKDEIEPHEALRQNWRKDLQLYSDYLDFKSERTSEGGLFAVEHGDMAKTMKDYLQAILRLKPSDTLHFTKHYFRSVVSSLDLPYNDYFEATSKHVRYYFFE